MWKKEGDWKGRYGGTIEMERKGGLGWKEREGCWKDRDKERG